MNLLIVVPKIVNRLGDFYQFPQGIAYISSSLREAGFNVFTVNPNHINASVDSILQNEIANHNIDIVLTGGLTGQYGAIRNIVESTKKIDRDISTIVGGGIITSAPVHAMQALEFTDYGVIGEGETICCELCSALSNATDVEDVAGIVFKKGSIYTVSKDKAAQVDLERLPLPDYKGLGLDLLLNSVPNIIGMCESNTVPIITSRSCPFKCTFCFHSSGQKFRQRTLDSVFTEIDHLVHEYDVKYLSIQDELFGHDIERVKEFCKRITNYDIKWWAQFRVSDVTQEIVRVLKASNCVTMAFGVESADNRILSS